MLENNKKYHSLSSNGLGNTKELKHNDPKRRKTLK